MQNIEKDLQARFNIKLIQQNSKDIHKYNKLQWVNIPMTQDILFNDGMIVKWLLLGIQERRGQEAKPRTKLKDCT